MLRVLTFILCLLQAQVLLSQNDSLQQKDIKVGLVLSGGGAKGFAHIGVLKILEKAGVRIDYIGGTSMGALIGGLYASGYSANEIDSIVRSTDFDDLMQDALPRKSKSVYQKKNDEKYALVLPIIKGKVSLPSAVSSGQNLFNTLSELTEHVHGVTDFSKLDIPFFCVATNLEKGTIEILETGFLPEAIKASGAFPTLLDPVEVNGKLLTDGGIVNNYPVDLMKKKGVDIIIGVDVQDKLKVQENLDTAPKIIMQIVSFQMYDDVAQKREDTDLYLHPDISNYNVISFDKVDEIIVKGEEVATKQFNSILEIAKKQNHVKGNRRIRKIKHSNTDKFLIHKLKIVGNKNYTKEYIQGKMLYKNNDSITYNQFIEGINSLSATGNFKSIHYKFVHTEDLELHLKLNEKEASTFIKLGAHYDDLYKTGVLLNFTSKHVLFKNDFISADVVLGDNIRYNIDYFIDNGFNWSFGIHSRYSKFKKDFFIGETVEELSTFKTPIEYGNFNTQLFLQRTFNSNTALRIGVEHQNLRIFNEILVDGIITKNFFDKNSYYSAFSKFSIDTYDKKYFIKKGFYLDLNYQSILFSTENNLDLQPNTEFKPFSLLFGKLGYAHTFFNKLTIQYISEAGMMFGGDSNGTFNYLLGGNNEFFIDNFTSFYGYDVADLNDESFLKSTFKLRYELFEKNHISFISNFARIEQNVFENLNLFDDILSGYAVGYGIDSFLGPIEIKYSWSPDTGNDYWFFNIGFWF